MQKIFDKSSQDFLFYFQVIYVSLRPRIGRHIPKLVKFRFLKKKMNKMYVAH